MNLNSLIGTNPSKKIRFKVLFSILLLSTSAIAFSQSLWIYTKAELAQILIRHSWQKTIRASENNEKLTDQNRPWAWADTWPVARLKAPKRNIDLYVLAGSQGNSLAFGPGHIDGTGDPAIATSGTIVYSGHRDTHFDFLKHIELNEAINVQDINGIWHHYQVTNREIKNIETDLWYIDTTSPQLKLVTCYPFNTVNPGGPLRLIITAEPVASFPRHIVLTKPLIF